MARTEEQTDFVTPFVESQNLKRTAQRAALSSVKLRHRSVPIIAKQSIRSAKEMCKRRLIYVRKSDTLTLFNF